MPVTATAMNTPKTTAELLELARKSYERALAEANQAYEAACTFGSHQRLAELDEATKLRDRLEEMVETLERTLRGEEMRAHLEQTSRRAEGSEA